ncbi:MAG: hypothetical protein M1546_01265 [Chloroflexi bacterium]|nr:hypothetical protein [Chloroflexota bacterium]
MTTKLSQHITRRINVSLVVALAVAWIVQTPATSAATSAPVSGSRDLLVSNLSPSRSVNANPSRDKWTNQPAEEYHAVTGQGQSVNHAQPITHVGDTAVKVQKPQQPAVTPYKTPIGRTSLAQSSPPSVTVMLLFNRQTAVNGTVVTGTMLMYGGYQSGTLYVYWYLPTGLTYVGNSASHTYTSTTTSYNSTARKLTFTYPGGYTTGQVITATWRMSLSVSAVPVNLTVSGSASPAACCVISPALLQVQAPDNTPHSITPGGGSVALTSRMTLDFPPGAVDSDVQVTGTEYALISTTTSGAPPSAVLKLELHPALSFNAPVTLSITVTDPAMRQLLMDQSWPGLQFVDKVSHQTEVVPLTYDPVSGRLIAQLTHFSDYEVNWKPAEPQPWKLAAHGGQVGTFRGSLNYAYPIKVPAVPGSTQPNLGIGYSSVAADSGVDESRNSYAGWSLGSASPGWTLDLPKITRLVRMRQAESYGSMQVQPGQWLVDARGNLYTTGGQFIAEPNGSNTLDAYCPGPDPCDFQGWFVEAMHEYRNEFTLDMAGVSYSLIPVNDAYTEYLTEPYTPMRIRRCNVHSVPACETDGWQDTSVDREWWQVWTTDGIRYVLGGDAMGTRFFEGMDGGGNVDTYDPSAMSDENYAGSQSGRVPVAWFVRKVYAPPANGGGVGAEYIYTNTSNILLDTIAYGPSVTPDGTPVSGNGFFTVTFSYSGVTLDAIQVDTRSGRLRKYVLAHSSSKLASIEEQGVDAETGRLITKIGYGNIDGRTLVTSIDNNYGATWRYFYAPTVYYNAHLVMSSTTTVLGQRLQYPLAVPALVYSSASTTTYTYEGPCYDRSGESCRANTGGDWGNSNGLIGFAVVTETVEHSNTPTEQRTVHKYHTELPHTGREYETRSLGRQLNTLSLQRTEYAVFTNDGISTTALVTFVAPVSVTVWPGGEGYPNYFKHTRISYDCGMQGGVFQGLQTGLAEYDGNYITPYRRSSAAYAFDAVAWFSRPISEALYDGLGNRLSEQRYYYDEQLFGVLGDQGDLTFVQELGKSGETTRDMQFSYDALGNMLSVTTWPDYGTLGVTYANGRAGATTMAVYDGAYGFFATTVTNPVGHVEQYFYYGVNELPPLDPNRVYEQKQPFGLLQFVQGPNGASMGTRYYYDALGRLSHVLQPGDNFGHPSVLYSYSTLPLKCLHK